MPAKEQRTTVGTPAGYDQSAVASLIAQAPEITKADRQEGYDINLVERGHKTPHPPSSRPRTVPPPAVRQDSGSPGSVEKTALPTTNGYATDVTKSRPTPWYRTTKGIAIIIVVAFVVVGAIVGVAVGVTQSKKNNSRAAGGTQTKEPGVTSAQTMPLSSIAPTNIASAGASGGAGENNGNNNGNNNTGINNNNGNTPINSGLPAFTGR